MILNSVSGKGSHDSADNILEDLPWELADRVVRGASHTIWQIVNHLIYWQDFSLDLVIGQIVLLRRLLGSWPPPSGGDTW